MSLTEVILDQGLKVGGGCFKVVSTGEFPLWVRVKMAFFALGDMLSRESYTMTIDDDLESVDVQPSKSIKSDIAYLWDTLNGKALVLLEMDEETNRVK